MSNTKLDINEIKSYEVIEDWLEGLSESSKKAILMQ